MELNRLKRGRVTCLQRKILLFLFLECTKLCLLNIKTFCFFISNRVFFFIVFECSVHCWILLWLPSIVFCDINVQSSIMFLFWYNFHGTRWNDHLYTSIFSHTLDPKRRSKNSVELDPNYVIFSTTDIRNSFLRFPAKGNSSFMLNRANLFTLFDLSVSWNW